MFVRFHIWVYQTIALFFKEPTSDLVDSPVNESNDIICLLFITLLIYSHDWKTFEVEKGECWPLKLNALLVALKSFSYKDTVRQLNIMSSNSVQLEHTEYLRESNHSSAMLKYLPLVIREVLDSFSRKSHTISFKISIWYSLQ